MIGKMVPRKLGLSPGYMAKAFVALMQIRNFYIFLFAKNDKFQMISISLIVKSYYNKGSRDWIG
jgi:hypothetical protein